MERKNFCTQLKCLLVDLEGDTRAFMSVAGSSAQKLERPSSHTANALRNRIRIKPIKTKVNCKAVEV